MFIDNNDRLIKDSKCRYDNSIELTEKIVKLNRCSKVVKGGRRFSFSALVAVGNGDGVVGLGFGKAKDIPDAIVKAVNNAKKKLICVNLIDKRIPHDVKCKYSRSVFVMRSALKGTGVVAGKNVKVLLELAGIKDVVCKSLGSRNIVNSIKAAFLCLSNLRNIKLEISRRLG